MHDDDRLGIISKTGRTDVVAWTTLRNAVLANSDHNFINVKDYGAVGDGITDDSAAIQEAMTYLLNQTQIAGVPGGLVLFFPSGSYRVEQTLSYADNDYAFVKMRILGEGMHQSVIYQPDPTKDIFSFTQTGAGYIGDLTVEDIQLYYGRHAIYCDNFAYSKCINVYFRGNSSGGTPDGYASLNLQGNTIASQLDGCLWRHGGDVLLVNNGTMTMNHCCIGEDVGNIHVVGSLTMNGCIIKGIADKLSATGWQNMGRAGITVDGTSRASLNNCSISIPDGLALANVDNAHLTIMGGSIVMNGGHIVGTYRMNENRGVLINGVTVSAAGSASVFASPLADNINNSKIEGVRLESNSGGTLAAGITDGVNSCVIGDNWGLS